MDIRVVKDYEEMSRVAAEIIARQVRHKPESVLGLATGSTPEGVYAILADKFKSGEVDFAKVSTFNLDEYCGLPESDDQSYHTFMENHVFSKLNIAPENTHIPDGNAKSLEKECASYDQKIAESGGVDLQILGIGIDGHIGFNEPSSEFSDGTTIVHLDESTIEANSRFFIDKTLVPTTAITMGVGTIMKARQILLMISGEKKAEIAYKALKGPVTPLVSASKLQEHPNVTVIIDEAAGRLL